MRRVGVLLTTVAALRSDLEARKSKVLDHDSYVRRQAAAEAAHTGASNAAAKAEARDALRKAEGKVRDSAAQVAQNVHSNEQIRAAVDSAGNAQRQCSQLGRSSSMLHSWWAENDSRMQCPAIVQGGYGHHVAGSGHGKWPRHVAGFGPRKPCTTLEVFAQSLPGAADDDIQTENQQ